MASPLTEKEKQVLKAFGMSDYGAYDSCMWMWEIRENSGLTGKQFSGICSSLAEKGIIGTDVEGDRNMISVKLEDTYTIWLTGEGIKAFQTEFPKP
jgi:hypothetical protein